MRFIITFAAVALVAGMIIPQFATQIYTPRAPHKLMAAREATPVQPVSSDPDSVVVAARRAWDTFALKAASTASSFSLWSIPAPRSLR